jgi:Domain of unknown function (DUF4349)
MPEVPVRRSLPKRILLVLGAVLAFTILFVVACHIAVQEIFTGIETSRATGLSSVPWDMRTMWSTGRRVGLDYASVNKSGEAWIARSADLRTRCSSFDQSTEKLQKIVGSHHGYFEELRTESRSGQGRALAASLSVPSAEFDSTLSDLKEIGQVEEVSEAGEDSAVRLATAVRHQTAAETNLSRLQNLQRGRKGELHDAVALEKEISQAREAAAEAQRQHEALLSTVAQAHIRVTLLEDYRAPLQANFSTALLQLRNSLVEGIRSIFSSAAICLGALFEFGLPLAFWSALLFWPARALWRRFRPVRLAVPATP